MTRKDALDIIRVEVAQNGKCTDFAMRIYVENRIGYASFKKTINEGLKQYRQLNNIPEPEPRFRIS